MTDFKNMSWEEIEQKNKTYDQWEPPIPFDNVSLPLFPIEIFPDWLESYIDSVSKATQTPHDLGALSALSILSILSSKHFTIKIKSDWEEHLNQYIMATMESGGGKSRTLKHYQKPVSQFENDEIERLKTEISNQEQNLEALEKRREHLKSEYAKNGDEETMKEITKLNDEIMELEESKLTYPRFFTSDVTAEKLAMLLAEQGEVMSIMTAEGGGVLKNIAGKYSSNGSSDIELYLSAYDGEELNIDRVGRSSIKLQEPLLNLCLFLQENVIQSLDNDFMEQGFVQRFIFSLPSSNVGYRNLSDDESYISDEVRTNYFKAIKRLLNMSHEPITLSFTPEADHLKKSIIDELETMLQEDGELRQSKTLKRWGSRLNSKVFKVTALLHIAKYALEKDIPSEIDKDTLEQAQKLIPYMISHAKATFGVMAMETDQENAKYVLKRIQDQKADNLRKRDIQQLVKHRLKSLELQASLDELEERGYIAQAKEDRKEVIIVNPSIID